MKKILAPLDFSEVSRLGLDYAIEIAELWNKRRHFVELVLFHVFNIPTVDPLGVEASAEIIESFQQQAEESMKEWFEYAKSKVSPEVKISSVVRMGFAIPEITSYAEEKEFDLIVITNQGETSLIEKVFGSVALGIIESSEVPVLSVPTNIDVKHFKKTFFSTNILTLDVYSLTWVLNFCSDIDSAIHFFTIVDDKFPFPTKKVKKVYEELMWLLNSLKSHRNEEELQTLFGPSYSVVETKDTIEGIENYVKHHKPDLIKKKKRHRSFLESFFKKSITLEVIKDINLPILVLLTYVRP